LAREDAKMARRRDMPEGMSVVPFDRTGPATFRAGISSIPPGIYTMHVLFDGADYPFERHCRYMRQPDETTPYTFPNMVFAEKPPGIRVGPWPGWRGIPEMPEVTVEAAGKSSPIRLQFWGDELSCRHIRGVVEIDIGGDSACTVASADERLIPVSAELFPSIPFDVEPIQTSLREGLAGTYPRLLMTKGELSALRDRKYTTHRHVWSRIEELFDSWNLPPAKTPESKAVEGPERLFGEDRTVLAAFRALLEPTDTHIEFARRSFFEYIELTDRDDFEPLRIDTQSGETLFTLCICYDWLYECLSVKERDRARERLWQVADICWGHLGYERHDYAQAHFLGCGLGILAFSYLFWESHPRAKEWASYLRGTFQRVIEMLPEDGFYPHGINLWIYEYGFLLRWLELFRVCGGEDLWSVTDHWKNASLFRLCATSPDFLYGVTIGDPQYRVGGDAWCHYLIAARTGSEEAQWLAEQLADGPHAGVDFRHIPPRRRVWEYLFYDPLIDSSASPLEGSHAKRGEVSHSLGALQTSPKRKHTTHNFPDGGQVFIRTHREGSETLFTFRSGPPIGHRRRQAGEPGAYGHSDPANGSFLLFRDNAFLATGSGPTYRRDTSLHNTITIDGKGQIGDSCVWLPDFFPQEVIPACTEVKTDGSATLLFADLTPAYLPHLGVEVCTRSMLIDAHAIVGLDVVQCASCSSIEWNLHTWASVQEVVEMGRCTFRIGDGANTIELHVLSPKDYFWHSGLTEGVPAYPNDGTRDTRLRFSMSESRVQWAWCILMADNLKPELLRDGEEIAIQGLSGGTIRFDGKWLTQEGVDEADA